MTEHVVTEAAVRRRRYLEEVAGSAVVVGLVASVPVAVLTLVAPLLVRALREGAGVAQAVASLWITDEEDWAMVPLYLLGALVLGALTALVASLAWSFVAARTPGRPWVAHVAAVLVAVSVPLLMLLLDPRWHWALPAVAAGLVALVAVPRLGYERRPAAT